MKISVDDKEIFTLSETQKKVIQNDIPKEIFEQDMCRRLKWILIDEKYEKCMQRLRMEWESKLKEKGVSSFPAHDEEFAELVFSQPEYQNRSQRDKV